MDAADAMHVPGAALASGQIRVIVEVPDWPDGVLESIDLFAGLFSGGLSEEPTGCGAGCHCCEVFYPRTIRSSVKNSATGRRLGSSMSLHSGEPSGQGEVEKQYLKVWRDCQ